MTAPLFVLAALGIFVLTFIIKGIRIVNQSTVKIVERLGKYHTTPKQD